MSLLVSVSLMVIMATGVTEPAPEAVSFDSDRWVWQARERVIEEHLGRSSMRLKGGAGFVDGASLTDGIVEFDISFTAERGFVGGIWRVVDPANYEEFYIRPHQSGKPDANQYTPIFNGASGWQLYHGEGHGAPVSYRFNTWIPVRIAFSGSRALIYVDDMATPAVIVHELKRDVTAGSVGVMASNFAPAWFSNFRFRALSGSPLEAAFKEPPQAEAGTIGRWTVSTAFAEGALDGKIMLNDADKAELSWVALSAESSGITNLARVQGIAGDSDTSFARVVVRSSEARSLRFRFGYSDRARVFLNDRLLYSGNNTYRSRDYRYLGTIGLFDELTLPLVAGDNELWIAVSESFGGWGVVGWLEPTAMVTVLAD